MNGPDPLDPATRTADDQPSTSWPSLTATHDANGTPVANPATTLHPDGGPTAWRPGVTAGRYQVLASHKTGGLGQVWVAYDTAVGRTVALKTIRPDRDRTANVVARFVREGQVTGQLEHPSIVPLYDLVPGAPNGDEPHYVMRFIHGRTLAEATAEYHKARTGGPPSRYDLRGLLDRFLGVCHAVAFAHSHHYLHRDLKGQNVVLGDFHEVFVVDWGLAKKLSDPEHIAGPDLPSPDSDPPTRPGTVVGTPAYMAPEVAAKQPATVASDVYGLGAVLYQILTDHPPTEATTADEALSKLTSGATIPSPRTYNPAVPAALEAVCRKALARTPADRYPSATDLAEDVRRWLADEPVSAYRERWPVRAARWARRHRTGVTAAAVALLLTAVGSAVAAGLIWQEKERTAAEKRKADDAKAEAETERDKYHAMLDAVRDYSDNLTDVVTEVETGLATGRSKLPDRKAALERAVTAAERLVVAQPDDPELQARLARLLRFAGNLARVRNDRAVAEKSLASAAAILQRLVDTRPEDALAQEALARAIDEDATVKTNFGRLREAADSLARGATVLSKLPATEREAASLRRVSGLNLLQRAVVETQLGHFDDAEAVATRATAVFAELLDSPPEERHFLDQTFQGMALSYLGVARREKVRLAGKGDYGRALAAHNQAVAVLRAAADVDASPDVWTNYYRAVLEQARTRLRAGTRPADLLGDVSKCVAGWRHLAAAHPGVAFHRQHLAQALTLRGGLLVAAVDEPAVRGLAGADLQAAWELIERLRGEAPDRPAYWADVAAVWSSWTHLLTNPAEVRKARATARGAAKGAVDRGPDHALHQQLVKELAPRSAPAAVPVTPDRHPNR